MDRPAHPDPQIGRYRPAKRLSAGNSGDRKAQQVMIDLPGRRLHSLPVVSGSPETARSSTEKRSKTSSIFTWGMRPVKPVRRMTPRCRPCSLSLAASRISTEIRPPSPIPRVPVLKVPIRPNDNVADAPTGLKARSKLRAYLCVSAPLRQIGALNSQNTPSTYYTPGTIPAQSPSKDRDSFEPTRPGLRMPFRSWRQLRSGPQRRHICSPGIVIRRMAK